MISTRRLWMALALVSCLPAPSRAGAPPVLTVEETLRPDYVVYPFVVPLLSRTAVDDRYELRIARTHGPAGTRTFHLSLTISRGPIRLVHRETSAPATAAGGAFFLESNLVPLVGTVWHGRLVSVVPWNYDGFTFLAEVREGGPDGPLVYRYRDPNKIMGISPKGLFDAYGLLIFVACVLGLVLATAMEARWRRGRAPAVVRFAGFVLAIVLLLSAGVTRYAILALAGAVVVAPVLSLGVRDRVTRWRPWIEALRRSSWRTRLVLLSPAVLTVFLACWCLLWHHALIVAYRFSPADFGEFVKLLLGLYFFLALGISAALHGWLLRTGATRRAQPVIAAMAVAFTLSGLMRILDGGAFLFSASHVDEDFWRLAFTRGNVRFAQDPLSLALLALLGGALLVFVGLLSLARRWPAAVAPLRALDASGAPRMSGGSLLAANGAVALVVLLAIHGLWLAAWRGPAREISSDVQQNFAGLPEVKFLQPLIRGYLAPPPSPPPPLAAPFVRKLERAGIRLYSVNPDYPLLKRSIYLDASRRRADTPRVGAGTNLIIITVESLSRSLLRQDIHGIRGLTPNFDDFKADSISFTNLFSSDFPTIKGMIAAFGSYMFDHRGLTIFTDANNPLKSRFLFLSDILHDRGYETIHAQADLGSFGNTSSILLKHQYDEVHGAESPAMLRMRIHPLTKPWGVYDEDLYRFVVARLRARDPRRPLFMTIAPTDTHFPYTNLAPLAATGGNELLNSVHGTDRAFGLFWDYFKASPYRDNTIVVLTGDHAMVTRALRAVDANMRLSEYDYIAAMMYVPGHESWRGRRIDTICTQVDIPPTLLDVMGLDLENPFLGLSIFAERPFYPLALSREIPVDPVTGGERSIVRELNWTPDDHAAFLTFLRGLAAADRIRPPSGAGTRRP